MISLKNEKIMKGEDKNNKLKISKWAQPQAIDYGIVLPE